MIIKIECNFSWKYAGCSDTREILEVEMTEEEYNNATIRYDMSQKAYEDWIWNEIGDYVYWEEVE